LTEGDRRKVAAIIIIILIWSKDIGCGENPNPPKSVIPCSRDLYHPFSVL